MVEVKAETTLMFELEIPETKVEEKQPEPEKAEIPSIMNMFYEEKEEEPKAVTSFLNKPSSTNWQTI